MTENQQIKDTESPAALRSNLIILAFFTPSVVMIIAFVALAVINLLFSPIFWMTGDIEPITPTPAVISIINITLQSIGVTGLVCLVPGIIKKRQ